ncbi:hypothetical protein KFL_000440240 [Klebsormidium nitens]|uniref:Centromere protein S n=1 Tax=Klebsormidium nitens TaxID=105231 RepID=A0A1Y1HPN1_KLENI|nr:hypothetical protein KFL_000440240 [Klebsormidium nitens]|eukprot:GAQ80023.1 hypothetical protein KFL_000440240 [Klebsormidium nitens]
MDRDNDPAAIGGASNEEEEEDELELESEPALTQAEREKRKERLRDRMKVAVARVVENEVTARTDFRVEVSPVVVSALAELTSKYAESLARDLESFAHHAGRKTVNVEDVLLAARRNPDVKAVLSDQAKALTGQQQPKKRKRPGLKALPGD